jgi:hypothetical protein
MLPRPNRAILVTGSHRSGTTWVGKMIASHPRVVYLSEPFNHERQDSPVRYWFHHVTGRDEQAFRDYLRPMMMFHHSWRDDFRERPGARRLVGATLRTLQGTWRRLRGGRPLLKDPIALFSAPWLADTFPMDVVVMIRHPAAFASSLKQLDWRFPFRDLLDQVELMGDWLAPFADEIRHFAALKPDIIDQACLLWRAFHHVIRRYQQTRPDWMFLRHEDLSANPNEGFGRVFQHLKLSMTVAVRDTVAAHTSASNPRDAEPGEVHQLRRDSRANVWSWKDRLTADEVRRVRRATEDVAKHFYSDADWDDRQAA